jgi:hypothetical protein
MTRGEEILEALSLKEASSKVSSLDKNSNNYKKEYEKIINEYSTKVINSIKEEDIEVRVAILDVLFNNSPSFTCLILSRRVESIIRAQLILELLKGVKPSDIKDHLLLVKTKTDKDLIMMNSNTSTIHYNEEVLDILNKYLDNKNGDDIDDMVFDDTITFADKLDEVASIMFKNNYYPDRKTIIYNLFSINYMDDEILTKIYNEIIIHMDDIDYDLLFDEDIEYLFRIKGIFRKCTNKVFDMLTSNAEDTDDLYDFLDEIINTNKEDREGLLWFFEEIGKREPSIRSYYRSFYE